MSSQRYTPEFKDEAVRQILERGYSVAEVSERLGVSSHSLYKWVKAVKPSGDSGSGLALLHSCLGEYSVWSYKWGRQWCYWLILGSEN